MAARVGNWLMRLFALDVLLPGAVWAVPLFVRLVVPNNRGAIEVTAVGVPIVLFLYRCKVGFIAIQTNNCGTLMRPMQFVVFLAAVVMLLLVDAFTILLHVIPVEAQTAEDYAIPQSPAKCLLNLPGTAPPAQHDRP